MNGEPATVVRLDRMRRALAALRELPRALSMNGTAPEWLVRTWVETNPEGTPFVVALVAKASWSVRACFPVNIVVEGERIRVEVRAARGGGEDWER